MIVYNITGKQLLKSSVTKKKQKQSLFVHVRGYCLFYAPIKL